MTVCATSGATGFTTQASGGLGYGISDQATISGNSPTGSITFDLFGPEDPTCAAAPIFTSTKPVSGNGTYTSDAFPATQPGTYRWIARYGGDADDPPASGKCGDPGESVEINSAIATTALYGISDRAVVTGVDPGGTVTFRLFGVSDPSCTGSPIFTSVIPVSGNGTYSSDTYPNPAAGTYRWIASYSGDAQNSPSTGQCGDSGESVTVLGTSPLFTAAFDPISVVVGQPSSLAFTITSSDAGGFSGLFFSNTLPPGLRVASPANVQNGCGFSAGLPTPGATSFAVSGGSVAGNGTCTLRVDVVASGAGVLQVTPSPLTTFESPPVAPPTATLVVAQAAAPLFAASFSPVSVDVGQPSSLIFTITTSDGSRRSGLAFTNTFPAGLQVAATANVQNTCGFTTGLPGPGATTFAVSGGSVDGGGACTLRFDVVASDAGVLQVTPSPLTTFESPPAVPPTAILVVAPPRAVPTASEWGLVALALALVWVALPQLRRLSRSSI